MALGEQAQLVEIHTISELSQVDWETLFAANRSIMQSEFWLRSARAAVQDRPLKGVAAKDAEGNTVGLAAFYFPKSPSRRLKILGGIDFGEVNDLVYFNEEILAGLIKGAVALNRVIDFGYVPSARPTLDVLRRATRRKGLVLTRALPQRGMPYLELNEQWKTPDACVSRNRRQSLRRKRRKAEALSDVRIMIDDTKVEDVDAALDMFVAVEANGWKGRDRTALAFDQQQQRFYRELCRRGAELGILRMCFLTIGDENAAAQICFEFDDCFWSLKVGYNEKFGQYSPGELLTFELIGHAARRDLRRFEFCGHEAGWTRGWTDAALEISSIRYYPFGWSGAIGLVEDSLSIAAKRLNAIWQKRLAKNKP